jgi:predicted RNA-binding Zn-ribbon protein involved in translation (DUF1610 family)
MRQIATHACMGFTCPNCGSDKVNQTKVSAPGGTPASGLNQPYPIL